MHGLLIFISGLSFFLWNLFVLEEVHGGRWPNRVLWLTMVPYIIIICAVFLLYLVLKAILALMGAGH